MKEEVIRVSEENIKLRLVVSRIEGQEPAPGSLPKRLAPLMVKQRGA
jgi:hypothetical protein